MIEVADVQDSQNLIAFPEMRQLNDGFGLQSIPRTTQMHRESHFDEIVGESEALRRVLREIETIASTDSTILIYGETGTGKELIARAVHNLSSRKSRAFVKVNCAAIPNRLAGERAFRT
jgi:formate hydrogenlyase transcriptional activator